LIFWSSQHPVTILVPFDTKNGIFVAMTAKPMPNLSIFL
jgi:hypothetical protein